MSFQSLQDELQRALDHHRAGQFVEAENAYRRILDRQANHPDALHLLGVLRMQAGRPAEAVPFFERAIAAQPASSEYHSNLGLALLHLNHLDAAMACLQKAIQFNPNLAVAHANLGEALLRLGQVDPAIVSLRQALALNPSLAQAHDNFGTALRYQGLFEQAAAEHRAAIALNPNFAQAHHNLGNALCDLRQFDRAIVSYQDALKIMPDYVAAWDHLGTALADLGRYDDAIAAFRQAIQRQPGFAEAHHNLGLALRRQGQLDEAAAAYRTAARLNPRMIPAHNNLGVALQDLGEIEQAIRCFEQSLAIDPNQPAVHSNLLFAKQCLPDLDPAVLFQEHREWDQRHAQPLAKFIKPHVRDRDPDRKLRIGYVSPDFRDHAVMRFFLPLLANHRRESFEIYCYANVARPDATTARLRALAGSWRDIESLRDEMAAQLIRDDQIDLLIDLAGHTSGNRLRVFAMKPAPIQLTWLGYPGTTGMSAIDYRITDEHSDPTGQTEMFHSEALVRLPQTAWCYDPGHTPEVGPTVSQRGSRVTFGSFNNLSKLTDPMLRLWGRILRETPQSALLLKAVGLGSASAKSRVLRIFAEQDIDPSRIRLESWTHTHEAHMALYHQVDIALDTFPYNGTTTTCDALWMGAPVVSLNGSTHVSRVGLSLLSNLGLADLSTGNAEDYLRATVHLASDDDRLTNLRQTLRERMKSSPLMDGARFTMNMETSYRSLWQAWCTTSTEPRKS